MTEEIRIPTQKPEIRHIERSNLLMKAKCFAEMLEKDNQRIFDAINEGRQDEVSIEVLDPNDDKTINMNLYTGIFESNIPEPLPPDNTEMPSGTWRSATAEPTNQ